MTIFREASTALGLAILALAACGGVDDAEELFAPPTSAPGLCPLGGDCGEPPAPKLEPADGGVPRPCYSPSMSKPPTSPKKPSIVLDPEDAEEIGRRLDEIPDLDRRGLLTPADEFLDELRAEVRQPQRRAG